MRLYLNAGFGDPIGDATLAEIRRLGFTGVRQDFQKPDDPFNDDHKRRLAEELAASQAPAILLVIGGKMGRDGNILPLDEVARLCESAARIANAAGLFDFPVPAVIEIGNEPDIAYGYEPNPAAFAELMRVGTEAVHAVRGDISVVSGGIATTNQRGLRYLERAAEHGLPKDIAIGYHTYRTTVPPEKAHSGFRNRDAEMTRLKRVAAGRPIWCTEAGWHTAKSQPSGWKFWKKVQFTDAQVADFVEREAAFNAKHGAVAFTVFQLNDGPEQQAYEHRFGIRYLDGSYKPVAQRVEQMARRLA